jgi:hypothetical protein
VELRLMLLITVSKTSRTCANEMVYTIVDLRVVEDREVVPHTPRRARSALETFSEDTKECVLTTDEGIEEEGLRPRGRRYGGCRRSGTSSRCFQ